MVALYGILADLVRCARNGPAHLFKTFHLEAIEFCDVAWCQATRVVSYHHPIKVELELQGFADHAL